MAKSRKTELDVDIVEAIPEAPESIPEIPAEAEEKKEDVAKKPLLTDKHLKIVLFAAIGMLFLMVIGIVLIVMLIEVPEKEEVIVKEVAVKGPDIHMERLTRFFLPMGEQKGENRFVRIGVSLELSSPGLSREIDRNLVILRENIYILFQESNKAWIRSTPKRKKIGLELRNLINMSLQTGTVKAVYFHELVIM